jgi:hypothetical protein
MFCNELVADSAVQQLGYDPAGAEPYHGEQRCAA